MRFGVGAAALTLFPIGIGYYVWYFVFRGDPEVPSWLFPRYLAAARFGEWLVGAWITELYVTGRLARLSGSVRSTAALLLLGTAIIVASILFAATIFGNVHEASEPFTTVGFAIILVTLLAREIRTGTWDRRSSGFVRIASWLGDRSYSLYLIHLFVFSIVITIANRLLTNRFDAETQQAIILPTLAGAVGVSVLAAHLLFNVIEKPSHSLARRFGKRNRPVPGGPASGLPAQSADKER